jgi:uncharacterized membrane protein
MDKIPQPIISMIVAMAGGVTNFLMDEEHTFFRLIVSIVTAGFAGYLVHLVGLERGYSENIISILCGIAGLSGEVILKLIKKMSVKYVKNNINNVNINKK